MTVAPPAPERERSPTGKVRQPRGVRLLRWVGWLLIAAGLVVLLYLVYSLFFTNLETDAAQEDLLERWELDVGDPETGDTADGDGEDPTGVQDPDGAVAVLEFVRPGSDQRPVHAEPLFVVEGVSVRDLTRGPGHYPGTALPGESGNFAVAGHRTTYGAPFFHLDQLRDGDEVVVTDRRRQVWTYRVVEQRIVAPSDASVLAPDPIGTGKPTLTLTTCHPRFSNRQRMIVFAELVDGPDVEPGEPAA